MKKNAILTFLLACLPGFGQMYLGYMKRGASMALWFWGGIGIIGMLRMDVLVFVLVVIWAYAFFDTFNIRNLTAEQRAQFYDDYVPSATWFGQNKKLQGLQGKAPRLLGWGLVALGLVLLYSTLVRPLLYRVAEYFPALYDLVYNAPYVVLALGVIVLGIWMLRGKKTPPSQNDEMIPFGGEEDKPEEQ